MKTKPRTTQAGYHSALTALARTCSHRRFVEAIAMVAVISSASTTLGQSFTVDKMSVGLPGTAVAARAPAPQHIFNNVNPPGPVPPGIGFSGNNFDDVIDPDQPDRDALSAGYEPLDSEQLWDLMFSVDRRSQGLSGTGVNLRFLGGNAVGGDYYYANPGLGPGMNRVMTFTDVHHGLANGPVGQQDVYDNIDGAEIWDSRAGVEVPYEGYRYLGDIVYDSINAGAGGDADIRENGNLLFLAQDLGLTQEDNVDALALDIGFEKELGEGDGQIEALFSLTPGSPSLRGPDGAPGTADDLSPADIFYTDFSGAFDIAGPSGLLGVFPGNLNFAFDLTARNLGLNFFPEDNLVDNIDAIDVIQTMTIYDFPMDPPDNPGRPLIPPPPCGPLADFNCDQRVDKIDLRIWEANFGNMNVPPFTDGDANGDGVANGNDFLQWQRSFMGPVVVTNSVPEPGSLAMLILAAFVLTVAPRHRTI